MSVDLSAVLIPSSARRCGQFCCAAIVAVGDVKDSSRLSERDDYYVAVAKATLTSFDVTKADELASARFITPGWGRGERIVFRTSCANPC